MNQNLPRLDYKTFLETYHRRQYAEAVAIIGPPSTPSLETPRRASVTKASLSPEMRAVPVTVGMLFDTLDTLTDSQLGFFDKLAKRIKALEANHANV